MPAAVVVPVTGVVGNTYLLTGLTANTTYYVKYVIVVAWAIFQLGIHWHLYMVELISGSEIVTQRLVKQ